MTPDEYRRAACLDRGDLWFSDDKQERVHARDICRVCPVRPACTTDGLREEYGIWGGLTERERAAGRTEMPPVREPVTCGTRRGYRQHKSLGEEACGPCRAANAANASDHRRVA